MPFDNFSVGKDVVIDVVTPSGNLPLPVTVTGFEMKAEYTQIKSTAMDGVTRKASLPSGWNGTITMDRRDNGIDSFFADLEAGFYAGQNILGSTITETISEADGTLSQYQYTGVSLSFENAGKKTGDTKIEQTIGCWASKRKQIV